MPRSTQRPADQRPVGHNEFLLTREILALSAAGSWAEAKSEWFLADLYRADRAEPGRCLCGHTPIIECCVIRNRETGAAAVVGSVCVRRFLGIASDKVFAGINRVARNRLSSLTPAALAFAHGKGWVNEWEFKFYRDTLRGRYLSDRQRAKRVQINSRVLHRFQEDNGWG